jgi:GT2 family glycosyltransferase
MTGGISLVIVNFNAGIDLLRCLEAVGSQTLTPDRLILVDNASTDGSSEAAESFLQMHPRLVRIAELLRNPTNLGFAAANNLAAARCKTKFVAFLNPDAIPHPDWLEKLALASSLHPQAASFGSLQYRDIHKQIVDGLGDVYHVSGACWRRRHGQKLLLSDLQRTEIFSTCAAAALYHRSAFLEVGGFDEDFFCYVEDVDLGFRLRLAGHTAVFVRDAVVEHSSRNRGSVAAVYYGHRNLVWCFCKNMPAPLLPMLLLPHLIQTVSAFMICSIRGQSQVFLRAKRHALMGLPKFLLKRKQIQKNRKASLVDIFLSFDKSLIHRR